MSRKKVRKERAVISKYIEEEIEAGRPYKQAIAIAYSRARREGYKLPVPKKRRTLTEMS
jgi:hypothetical protein